MRSNRTERFRVPSVPWLTRKKADALRKKRAAERVDPLLPLGSRFHHRLVKSHRSHAVRSEHAGNAANEQAAAFKGTPGAVSPCWTRSCTSLVSVVSRGICSTSWLYPLRVYARFQQRRTEALLSRSNVIDSWYLYRIDSADKLEDTARRIADLHELWSRVHCD